MVFDRVVCIYKNKQYFYSDIWFTLLSTSAFYEHFGRKCFSCGGFIRITYTSWQLLVSLSIQFILMVAVRIFSNSTVLIGWTTVWPAKKVHVKISLFWLLSKAWQRFICRLSIIQNNFIVKIRQIWQELESSVTKSPSKSIFYHRQFANSTLRAFWLTTPAKPTLRFGTHFFNSYLALHLSKKNTCSVFVGHPISFKSIVRQNRTYEHHFFVCVESMHQGLSDSMYGNRIKLSYETIP